MLFLAELNGLEKYTGDVGNEYLEAYTEQKVVVMVGPQFAPYGHDRHMLEIVKAIYGLKASAARLHVKFSETMVSLGFKPDAEGNRIPVERSRTNELAPGWRLQKFL